MNQLSKMKRHRINNVMNKILLILTTCMPKDKRYYTKVSVNKIIKLLDEIHGIKVGRSWIFKCLKRLEDEGLFTRRQRRGRNADGSVWQLSSMIAFTAKGAKLLITNGIEKGKKILKSIMEFMAGKDKRFPRYPDPSRATQAQADPKQQKELKAMVEIVTKPF